MIISGINDKGEKILNILTTDNHQIKVQDTMILKEG